jgi:hypothetical protein
MLETRRKKCGTVTSPSRQQEEHSMEANNVGAELYKIMDALVALKVDLSCDPYIPGETLVLSADKSRDACEALEAAFESVKKIASALNGGEDGGFPAH